MLLNLLVALIAALIAKVIFSEFAATAKYANVLALIIGIIVFLISLNHPLW